MPENNPTVLQRKAGAGRPEPEYGVVSPERALRLGVSKAAQDVLKIPMAVKDIQETRIAVSTMADALPENALTMLLQGQGAARGLLCLDPICLKGVIQGLTLRSITSLEATERPPTGTDAMMTRQFMAVFLAAMEEALVAHPAAQWARGYVTRERISDTKRLPHLLKDIAYRGFRVSLDIGNGAGTGEILVIFPIPETAPEALAPGLGGEQSPENWTNALERQVLDSPADMEVVLHRLTLTLSDLVSLKSGQVLTVPLRALSEVSLENDGEQVGLARLGKSDGMRAICIEATLSDNGIDSPSESKPEATQPTGGPQEKPDAQVQLPIPQVSTMEDGGEQQP